MVLFYLWYYFIYGIILFMVLFYSLQYIAQRFCETMSAHVFFLGYGSCGINQRSLSSS